MGPTMDSSWTQYIRSGEADVPSAPGFSPFTVDPDMDYGSRGGFTPSSFVPPIGGSGSLSGDIYDYDAGASHLPVDYSVFDPEQTALVDPNKSVDYPPMGSPWSSADLTMTPEEAADLQAARDTVADTGPGGSSYNEYYYSRVPEEGYVYYQDAQGNWQRATNTGRRRNIDWRNRNRGVGDLDRHAWRRLSRRLRSGKPLGVWQQAALGRGPNVQALGGPDVGAPQPTQAPTTPTAEEEPLPENVVAGLTNWRP